MKIKTAAAVFSLAVLLYGETFLRIDIDSVDYSRWPKLELYATLVDFVGENTTIDPKNCFGRHGGDREMEQNCPSLTIRENGKLITDVEYSIERISSPNSTEMIIFYESLAELEDEKRAHMRIDIYGVHNGYGDTLNIDTYPRVGAALPNWSVLFKEADRELNLLYEKVSKNIPAKEMERLRQAQRNWLTFRDSEALVISGQGDRLLYERTRTRIAELEEMLNRLR